MALHEGYALLILPWRADYIYAQHQAQHGDVVQGKGPERSEIGRAWVMFSPTRSKLWLYNVAVHTRFGRGAETNRPETPQKIS